MSARRVARGVGLLFVASGCAMGCASLLRFEDFEGREPGAAGAVAAGGAAGAGDRATGGTTSGGVPPAGGTAGAATCGSGTHSCGGGETRLVVRECDADGEWVVSDNCSDQQLQCHPTSGDCIELGIDPTEVTRARYREFLDALASDAPPPLDMPGTRGCAWNSSFAPEANCMSDESVCSESCDDHPQVCVDWCDAATYCEWAGKQLCGRIGGDGMVDFDSEYDDPGVSAWMNACSAGGQFEYGSGPNPPAAEPGTCSFGDRLSKTHEVGQQSACHSPAPGYDEVFDLSGNVAEWENACTRAHTSENAGRTDVCRHRGGSFVSPAEEIRCATVPTDTVARDAVLPTLGFRCCAK